MKSICILSILALGITLSYGADEAKKEGDKKRPNLEEVFAKKDTNGDGKLSKEEFTKNAKDPAKAEAFFAKIDKDGDGSISKEEFVNRPNRKKEGK